MHLKSTWPKNLPEGKCHFGQASLSYIKTHNKQRIFIQRANSADVALLGRREEAVLDMMSALSPSSPSRSERLGPEGRNAEICLDSTMAPSKVLSVGERARKQEKQRSGLVFRALNRFVKTPRLIYAKRSPCRRGFASPEHFLSPDPHFDASVRGAQWKAASLPLTPPFLQFLPCKDNQVYVKYVCSFDSLR